MKKVLITILLILFIGLLIFFIYNTSNLSKLKNDNNKVIEKVNNNDKKIKKLNEEKDNLEKDKKKIEDEKKEIIKRYENWKKKNETIKEYIK